MAKTRFPGLLSAALEAADAFEKVNGGQKLSAKGFFKAACAAAHAAPDDVRALAHTIANDERLAACRAFVNTTARWIAEGTVKNCPTDARRIRHLARPELDAELPILGADLFQLFAVGVLLGGQRFSERFGEIDDWGDYQRRVKELERRRDEAFEALEKGYELPDLDFGEPDANGNARVSFKLTGGAVHVGVDVAPRLVAWARNNPSAKW
ncbi:MAG: hypothetical protein HY804_05805 [Nitrospinae bacterium]|nr:hypothetical protein [Nitrospinota bacterium]